MWLTGDDPSVVARRTCVAAWLAFAAASYKTQGTFSILAFLFAVLLVLLLGALRPATSVTRNEACVLIVAWAVIQPLLTGYGSVLPAWQEAAVVFASSLALLSVAALGVLNRSMMDQAALITAALTLIVIETMVMFDPRVPAIDVFHFVNQAADKVVTGNIYGTTWTDINAADPVVVTKGFPYLPMTALLLAPFRWMLGDARWGLLLATLISGAVLAWVSCRTRSGTMLGAFLLLSPATLLMVESAWTETLVLALLLPALVLFAVGRSIAGVILLALALATKQHVIVLLPLLAAWRTVGWRHAGLALAGAASLCLPWVIANPRTFVHDTVGLHLDIAPRVDALTVHAASAQIGWELPTWLTGLVVLITIAIATLWVHRRKPDLGVFSGAAAFTLLIVNLFNSQAFINQFWLCSGLLMLAFATSGTGNFGNASDPDNLSAPQPTIAAEG